MVENGLGCAVNSGSVKNTIFLMEISVITIDVKKNSYL